MTVQVTRLPSGLSVVTDRMPHLETASLGVWIGSGSRDEKPDEHGISHLLEHMAFKGTKRRTARQIAEAIEAVGGDLNAATSVESTGYFARVLKADVPLAIDVLSDILSDPTFDAEELKREQNVIVQEIGATEDAPDDLVFDRLQETAFPKQPVGRSILGTPETVRSFNPMRLRAYLSRNYTAPDMVVAAAGAVDHAAIVADVEKRFASFTGPAAPTPRTGAISAAARASRRAISSRSISRWRCKGCRCATTSFTACRCSPACSAAACRRACSRKCARIRGLCYSIHAFHMPYADTGLFGLYAGTDETDAPELMRVVIDQIGNATETLNDTEINRAKAQMKAGLLMALESSEARVGQLARQMLAYGRPIPLDEIVAKVDAVTIASARAAGRCVDQRAQSLRSRRSAPATALPAPPRSLKVCFAAQPEPRDRPYVHGILPHRQLQRDRSRASRAPA